jgi:hypothetical protein
VRVKRKIEAEYRELLGAKAFEALVASLKKLAAVEEEGR